jgi:hypothetical protein
VAPRAYLAGCAAIIGFALGYALPAFGRLANLYYDPIARRFLVGARPGPLPMGYLGQVLWGAGCALAGAGATWAVVGRRRAPSESSLGLAAAWALTALVLVGAYFTWNNWP